MSQKAVHAAGGRLHAHLHQDAGAKIGTWLRRSTRCGKRMYETNLAMQLLLHSTWPANTMKRHCHHGEGRHDGLSCHVPQRPRCHAARAPARGGSITLHVAQCIVTVMQLAVLAAMIMRMPAAHTELMLKRSCTCGKHSHREPLRGSRVRELEAPGRGDPHCELDFRRLARLERAGDRRHV
jgi:hypothetical protein